jgi:hypothetical protein
MRKIQNGHQEKQINNIWERRRTRNLKKNDCKAVWKAIRKRGVQRKQRKMKKSGWEKRGDRGERAQA